MSDHKIRFSVDTHLFRELGELLVGRESTALIELVKNAYDADATQITVYGEGLDDPEHGVIRISDDGVGMTPDIFERGFLRIAGRLKGEGSRRSKRFGRRYTGAKGVGRLAAHKLARELEVVSTPWSDADNKTTASAPSLTGVSGTIKWDQVESAETLDKITDEAVVVKEIALDAPTKEGTTLTLTHLRRKWSKSQLGRFLLEVEALQAPSVITGVLPKAVLGAPGLFESPMVVDASAQDPGLKVKLEGAFETGDNYWTSVVDAAHWVLEIDASSTGLRYFVSPTAQWIRKNGAFEARSWSEEHPSPEEGPFFQARIIIREGSAKGRTDTRAWASRVSGVRVYMEGFRVLPYGDESDDWLFLSRDVTARDRKLRFLSDDIDDLPEADDEGLLLLPSKHYLGGVFLTVDRSGSLDMLVNREGFVPGEALDRLVTIVRKGIDLTTRVRASAKATPPVPISTPDEQGSLEWQREDAQSGPKTALKGRAEATFQKLENQAANLERLAHSLPIAFRPQLLNAASEIQNAASISRELMPSGSMILVLASVGTQLAAFTHEVSRLLSTASDLEALLGSIRTQVPSPVAQQLSKVSNGAADLRRAIERQAAYLLDIVTPDSRRRRSRQPCNEILDAAWRLVSTSAEQRGIGWQNEVPADARTPPMFRAELMAIFSNLLTNAVKAAGKNGKIRAISALQSDGTLILHMENTGAAVDPAEGERWFKPFESSSVEVDPVLGQGMGLGLVITRDLLSDVGGTIEFVAANQGFATALALKFPGANQE
jgi:signal transduction histidine kinase